MVVTSGTTDCQAEERLANSVDLFINDVHFQKLLVLQFIVGWSEQ